jgi:hypothetical protein
MIAKWRLICLAVMTGIALGITGILLLARSAQAHCDTLNGPVVKDAQRALAKGDVTPVLKWVKPKYEAEVRAVFSKTLSARANDPKAASKNDLKLFETVVRLHRAGEGEPFTGLKPPDQVEPIIAAADQALDRGAADKLVKMVTDDIAAGIRKRFAVAAAARKRADVSVPEGRKYVEAYVAYVHYVERLHDTATAKGGLLDEAARAGSVSHGDRTATDRGTKLR